jgi:hypothetical protein
MEKEYGDRKKFTVKQRVCEIALESILKLDRAEQQDGPRDSLRGPFLLPPHQFVPGRHSDPNCVVFRVQSCSSQIQQSGAG